MATKTNRNAAERKSVEAALISIAHRGTAVVRGRMVTRSTNGQRYTVMGAKQASMWLYEAVGYLAL